MQRSGASGKTYCGSLNKPPEELLIFTINSSRASKLFLNQRRKSNEGKMKRTVVARSV